MLHNELMHTHYAWIKNLSALIQQQVTNTNRSKKYICDRCLHYFYSQFRLNKHIGQCNLLNESKIMLPNKKNRWVHFKNFKNKIEVPFIIYADIESLLIPKQSDNDANVEDNEECSTSSQSAAAPKGTTQIHIPNSIGYYFHSHLDPSASHYESFFGPDCISKFIERLKDLMVNIVWPKLNEVKPMDLSEQEEIDFLCATVCHICNRAFLPDDITDKNSSDDESVGKKRTKKIIVRFNKVRDHCHLTGKFRGAAHSQCNLKYQVSKNIPVVFHNLGYDSHFPIERLASMFPGNISIIPKTSEDYISFSKELLKSAFISDKNKDRETEDGMDCDGGDANDNDNPMKHRENLRLRFIDSYRFLPCALATLAQNLPADIRLHIARKEWINLSENDFQMLTKQGVYPYTYMNSWDKFDDKELPTQNDFYDDLNDTTISNEEYAFAQRVWNTFKIGSMREYTNLYLKTDVLLLADIFENFRDNCIKLYGLDPAHYYTLPGYSWDCMLKYTQVYIELLTDIDMLLFVEQGLRGGISQCSKRHSKANNKYMGPDYDVSKPTKYIIYFDVNNLYGWAMNQPLPISNYSWIDIYNRFDNIKEIESYILEYPDDAQYGCMLEVDLEYPKHLHDLHNDYPFCSEHLNVGDSSVKKLVLTLHDKTNYITHYQMLKTALLHGFLV